ncbi:hypothetical protein CI610_03458 [invertebrate metagenome]|uniref:Uncharacterized protein n=3 Tax=root TaxID=1 RepID=A0A2H9T306_9ZZZZ
MATKAVQLLTVLTEIIEEEEEEGMDDEDHNNFLILGIAALSKT